MLVLLNDIECDLDEAGLMTGDSDSPATPNGDKQALCIAVNLHKHVDHLDVMMASPAVRLRRLIHCIRLQSPKEYLTRNKVVYLSALKERNFGVLNGTVIDLSSDLFTNTRICAEGGESIAQVRARIMPVFEKICQESQTVLVVTHPFVCQIAFNSLMGRKQVSMDDFWFKKGSMIILKDRQIQKAINLVDDEKWNL
jgi:broad specificity phosphatase PhoE